LNTGTDYQSTDIVTTRLASVPNCAADPKKR
jgi:hypothetical protein